MSVRVMTRPASGWKNRALRKLIERDGQTCCECGAEQRYDWSPFGEWFNSDWGSRREAGILWLGSYTSIRLRSFLEVEHTVPLADGGTNNLSNLRLMCRNCHKSKTIAEHSRRRRRAA